MIKNPTDPKSWRDASREWENIPENFEMADTEFCKQIQITCSEIAEKIENGDVFDIERYIQKKLKPKEPLFLRLIKKMWRKK